MKKIIALLSLALVLVTMACTNKSSEAKKEVIVVPVVKDPPAKSTTVTLDNKGVKVETKKVKVSVNN